VPTRRGVGGCRGPPVRTSLWETGRARGTGLRCHVAGLGLPRSLATRQRWRQRVRHRCHPGRCRGPARPPAHPDACQGLLNVLADCDAARAIESPVDLRCSASSRGRSTAGSAPQPECAGATCVGPVRTIHGQREPEPGPVAGRGRGPPQRRRLAGHLSGTVGGDANAVILPGYHGLCPREPRTAPRRRPGDGVLTVTRCRHPVEVDRPPAASEHGPRLDVERSRRSGQYFGPWT